MLYRKDKNYIYLGIIYQDTQEEIKDEYYKRVSFRNIAKIQYKTTTNSHLNQDKITEIICFKFKNPIDTTKQYRIAFFDKRTNEIVRTGLVFEEEISENKIEIRPDPKYGWSVMYDYY
jgi:hypothetical protein